MAEGKKHPCTKNISGNRWSSHSVLIKIISVWSWSWSVSFDTQAQTCRPHATIGAFNSFTLTVLLYFFFYTYSSGSCHLNYSVRRTREWKLWFTTAVYSEAMIDEAVSITMLQTQTTSQQRCSQCRRFRQLPTSSLSPTTAGGWLK